MKPIKIAVADDYSIFREGIKLALKRDERLPLVVEAGNADDLLKGVEQNPVDVILLDYKMPVMDGLEATIAFRKKATPTRVLLTTMFSDEKFIIQLMALY